MSYPTSSAGRFLAAASAALCMISAFQARGDVQGPLTFESTAYARPYCSIYGAEEERARIAALADVDGDGVDDLVIGAIYGQGETNQDTETGRTYVIGGGSWIAYTEQRAPDIADETIFGDQVDDRTPFLVHALPDLGGDGRDEVALCAPEYDDESDPADDEGMLLLIAGHAPLGSGSPVGLWDPMWGYIAYELGAYPGAQLGQRMGHGNVDGDGQTDIVVGAARREIDGTIGAGAAHLFLGQGRGGFAGAWDPEDPAEGADVTWYGEWTLGNLGRYVDILPDLDQDGMDELIIGVSRDPEDWTGGGDFMTRLYLYYGRETDAWEGLTLADADVEFFESKGDTHATKDNRIRTINAGDIDGDGWDDLAIGSARACIQDQGCSGAVWIFYGGDTRWQGSVDLTTFDPAEHSAVRIDGGQVKGEFGSALAALGDWNDDGADDLAIGEWKWSIDPASSDENDGSIHVFFGQRWSGTIDADAAHTFVVRGDQERVGWELAASKDLDGDDYRDILSGSPRYLESPSFNFHGRVVALYGGEDASYFDTDGDGYWSAGGGRCMVTEPDCDDGDAGVYPGAEEIWYDGVDQDCDGNDDDADGDGVPYPEDCDDTDPDLNDDDADSDGYSTCDGDCDDGDGAFHPHADEDGGTGTGIGNGLDDDCDGLTDEGTLTVDDDGDGYTELPDGDGGTAYGDCDDGDPEIHPGAPEGVEEDGVLNGDGVDNDCDGLVDEGTIDGDDDGDGWTERDGDCDDGDASIHPEAAEIRNLLDDDCDGVVDEVGPGDCRCALGGRPSQLPGLALALWIGLLQARRSGRHHRR